MGSLGMPEILIILVIALIIFGPRKLPELGKSLGQGLAHFRRASEDFKRQWEDEVDMERRRIDAPVQPSVESAPYSQAEAVSEPSSDATAEPQQSETAPVEGATATHQPATVARETGIDWS